MTKEQIEALRGQEEQIVQYMAKQRLVNFARYVNPKLEMSDFHKVYYKVLDMFAHKKIKKLIVSVPPQHGKSEGSSRFLPAFMLGLNPDDKIIIGSYNADVAKNFNRDVQRIIQSQQYGAVFPDSFVSTQAKVTMDNVYRCNAEMTEMVGRKGSLVAVGRNGSLTSKSVDVSILDDVYKDFQEANSPSIREISWRWYTAVVRTRLHNNSQELIVFTRWHEDDLIGRIEKSGEQVVVVKSWADIENVPKNAWLLLNFPALKVGDPTELDPRENGQALWQSRHSREKLIAQRNMDPVVFECLYQGNPGSAEGRLYEPFKTYADKSEYGVLVRKGCMCDTADKGTDYLCSIAYDIYRSPNTVYNEQTKKWEPILYALVTDIIFTQEGTELTEVMVPRQVNTQGTQKLFIESNSGGSQFARNVGKKIKALVETFFTSMNKESKIISNASAVNRSIVFPLGWEKMYPEFYNHITKFLRYFKAMEHDDDADVLTEIYLREIAPGNVKPYKAHGRGVRRGN